MLTYVVRNVGLRVVTARGRCLFHVNFRIAYVNSGWKPERKCVKDLEVDGG